MNAKDTTHKSRNDPPGSPRRISPLRGGMPRLVLGLLKSGEGSGFALTSRLEQRGCTFFRRQEATIYPILHDLERKGLVLACWCQRSDGSARRCYRLTDKGNARLNRVKNRRKIP